MVNVYAWPPVATMSKEWTIYDPVSTSKNLMNGAEYVSAAQRRRRIATIEASSRFSPYSAGAGYMEALKRILKGGVNLVRLTHKPRVFDQRVIDASLKTGEYVGWIEPSDPVEWIEPIDEVIWGIGVILEYTVVSGQGVPTIDVIAGSAENTRLPPNSLIAVPGEFATVVAGGVSLRIMILAPVFSDSTGAARVKLEIEPAPGGHISFGTPDTAVFKADAMPRAVEPAGSDWSYTWNFTEVFEDERGPFVEVNPWS